MIRKTKLLFVSLVALSGFFGAAFVAVPAAAMPTAPQPLLADFQSDACGGLKSLDSSGCASSGGAISNLMKAIIEILSLIVGFITVVMIIISGFRFITANGDSNKIASARSGLIYALVGIVIVVMAQTIVHFVLHRVGGV